MDKQYLFPQLWNRCIFAMYPKLTGFTGTKVWDNSYKQQHGTFNGLAPASAWITYNGKIAMVTPASSAQYCDFGTFTLPSYFTCVAWISAVSLTSTAKSYISNENLASFNGFTIGVNTSNQIVGRVCDGSITSSTTASANTDYCVILSSETSSSTPTLYINGINVGTSGVAISTYSAGGNLFMGKRPTGLSSQPSDVRIYECRIYDRILSQYEINILSKYVGISYVPKNKTRLKTIINTTKNKYLMNLGHPMTMG